MSLINEALKRARVEAARRDAEAKGVPPEALPVYVPPRRRSWLAPALGFAAGLAVVAVAFGAFWVARQPAPAEQAPMAASIPAPAVAAEGAPPSAPVDAAPPPAAPVSAAEPEPAPAAAAVPPPSPGPAAAQPRAAEPPAAKAPAPELRSFETPTAPDTETPPASPPPPPAEASAPAAPDEPLPAAAGEIPSYMRQASPAGAAVKIDFIVWSESRPFAQINGQLLSAGQSVNGYTLLKVERERVELEGGGQRFWLRVK